MSMFSGLMGGGDSEKAATPGAAPNAPGRDDKKTIRMATKQYKRAQKTNSYAKALLYESGGTAGAPAPTTSRAAQLMTGGGI